MKLKTIGITLAASLTLVGCGADNELGQGTEELDQLNDGVQQTRFNNGTDFPETGNAPLGDNVQNNQGMIDDRDENDIVDNNEEEYDIGEKAAERIVQEVEGVDEAYVLTTGDNAYVAAELSTDDKADNEGEDEVSDKVKRQITDVVKSVNNDIDDVYVSSNPDFVDLTTDYVNDVENGDPVEGFFNEFGDMVERIFPQAE